MAGGIGYENISGLTYDGYAIDPKTLFITGNPRIWSSPVKEALHLHTLALFLNNNSLAQWMLSASIPTATQTDGVLTLLEKKLASYISFNTRYPGFGYFLPWFVIVNGLAYPAEDWLNRVPSLDNGMYFWSIYHTYHALLEYSAGTLPQSVAVRATALANGFNNILVSLKTNMAPIFYEGSGVVRGVAIVNNTALVPTATKYSMEGTYALNDPYDGELMTMAMDLFSTLSQSNKTLIWTAKAAMLQQSTYTVQNGVLNAQTGWYSSAHELWKFLILPYRDVAGADNALANTVKSYTWYSSMNNLDGLWTEVSSIQDNLTTDSQYFLYNAGIDSLSYT